MLAELRSDPDTSRIEYWLRIWAQWQRRSDMRLGYPARSLALVSGGASRRTDEWIEDESERIESRNAQAMDALINDLPPAQRAAIHCSWLGATFRFPRQNFNVLLQQAYVRLLAGMDRRDIV